MSAPAPDGGNPFDLLADNHDGGQRWAFGTGFTDPLEGIDTSVPDGVDPGALARYCLALGDDALIYSHRLQEWVTRLPELEEETAVANIALDLLGQARMLLARAGGILGKTEDELAFFRPEQEFRNVRLAEHADGDFAELTVRLLVFSTWRLALFESLAGTSGLAPAPDPVLAAIAAKGVNELAYHRDYAAQWVIRLGDGTDLSHAKAQAALGTLWPLVGDLFRPDPDAAAVRPGGPAASEPAAGEPAAGEPAAGGPAASELAASEPAAGVTVDRGPFDAVIDTVLATATLDRPAVLSRTVAPLALVGGKAGRDGVHTEAMGHLLAGLQSVARAYPDATW